MATAETPLTDVLDELAGSGHEDGVTVGEVLESFEHRSLGFLLTLWGLLAAMPIVGDIPGASIILATLILVSIAQHMLGRGHLWAPERVRRRQVSRERFDKAISWTRPVTRFIDRLLKPRLTFLVKGRANHVLIAAACAALALTYYPLAFVPFGVNAPAAATVALGLGLMACDGLFVALGYGCCALTAYLLVTNPLTG